MENEKSLLYSLFEKFNKKEQEKEEKKVLEASENIDNSTETIKEEAPILKKLNFISELCISLGYNDEYNKNLPEEEHDAFDKLLDALTKEYLTKIESNETLNSNAVIFTSRDNLTAYAFLLPSINDGENISFEELKQIIQNDKIQYGIKEDILETIIRENQYCQCIPFAFGDSPTDGKDSKIIEFSKINTKSSFIEDEHGRIDFKKLNLENNITKDSLICKIIPPVDGIDGMSVFGKVLPSKKGKNLPSPAGNGTYIPENASVLLALQDGRLSFSNGKYCVEKVFSLKSNVDNATGNIDFVGDVIISGDVKAGFMIKAGGSIIINGTAEDCVLIAGNDITIKEGINADGHGKLEAGADINCKYIENCQVICKGTIKTGSIINSIVFSDNSIEVTSGKGVILGSQLTALKSILANTVGSSAGREVLIKLGTSYNLSEEISNLKSEISKTEKTLDMLHKNINFLSSLEQLEDDKKTLLNQLLEQYKLYKSKFLEMNERKQVIEDEIRDYSKCKFEAKTIYPPCRLNIAEINYKITDNLLRSTFRLVDGDIKLFTT